MKYLLPLVILSLSPLIGYSQPKTLRDSLLQVYSLEELEEMPLREFGNAVRKLRGQDPLPPLPPPKTTDDYGIKLIKDIPKESAKNQIDTWVKQIEKEKHTYRQEVFPNTYIDVMDGHRERFYQNYVTRKVSSYKRVYFNDVQDSDSSIYSNFSKRIYYFNKNRELRLITREMEYGINDGPTPQITEYHPYKYFYEAFYIWNDSIRYKTLLEGRQVIGGFPEYFELIELDTSKVVADFLEVYYFKNNSFNLLEKEGSFPKENWKNEFKNKPSRLQELTANTSVIHLRNLLKEREEYWNDENDYLHPCPSSFFEPYVIEPDE